MRDRSIDKCVPNFRRYSAFYDLLYGDKDYLAEAEYVARTIRHLNPQARTILEFGSGTGRHGRLLAGMGFKVHGIERSQDMVSVAMAASNPASSQTCGSFSCEVGDIRTAKLSGTFDAVIACFHVVSYQTTDAALRATFRVAADHLTAGGIFLFDVWHGPAVLCQKPSQRVKEVADERYQVRRTARPELDTHRNTVRVVYQIECEDRQSGEAFQFCEEHQMRYLFSTEVDLLAARSGLSVEKSEEFLTGAPPSPSTWGVFYVLQRCACPKEDCGTQNDQNIPAGPPGMLFT
jgi:SAM-dependent methyltransferase